jgi:membrane protein
MFVILKAIGISLQNFLKDDCLTNGAAIAYYTIFSLPPLLVIVLMIASSLGFSKQDVNRIIHEELGFPATETVTNIELGSPKAGSKNAASTASAAEASTPKSDSASETIGQLKIGQLGTVSRIVGIGILLFSATGIFGQLQYSLNRIWEVEPDPRQGGFRRFLLKRLFSAGMVIVIGFVLLTSLILTTMVDQVLVLMNGRAPGFIEQTAGLILNEVATFAVAVLLFGSMFRILPDAKFRLKDVWLGATATALLFVFGKAVIGWYLRTSEVGSSWGASAASSVAALVWVYYSSLIVLFGAELTRAWATRNGGTYEPARGAVRTVEEKRHIRG